MIVKGDENMTENPNAAYQKKVEALSPKSPLLKNCIWAFLCGGALCLFAELLFTAYTGWGAAEKEARTCVSITIVALTALFTALGVYDKAAKHAGAGFAVPISGFANSVVSAAMEYSTEGRILGTAVKMFTLAGPVIVYGCSFAMIYGLIYYFFLM
ncbi:MAG: SpoVA/SpoVAEb family sporulation membrane protein [Clostridia bacterium]|nr:SpoVA/SpoVAEb family sporulation membrane protein [Clostridia bacterium]